ncbi:carbon starvation protein CstA [Ignatzschineria rhizosphaerae]|uniref:Carbon starvation protein CstA n=1 Tax=Ignatzschineria rhizosphaerae TaxID=2923279 RepID=A0ABY3X491_9GAMM|nr:pyruvate/proton symporter CstA [Ignatzschineria rhizosphaerae]UNM96576.1 carbon starvation protein CstA [Ignatzschineria rhizosphaerae]
MVATSSRGFKSHLIWVVVAVLGALCLGYVALNRGETINAMWVLTASICVYLIGYRYYSLYIAKRVLKVDSTRLTPAFKHNDGLDYVPTRKSILFGHHFAAIAGAGPLVGPVLAAQMGYLPGMLWILAGVIFAGAVQDFMVLFVSTRRDGKSLGELIKSEMGSIPGIIALIACFMIMIIILAVLAMIVVKALEHSPWGTFAVAFTIPLAVFMGVYMRYIRPGRVLEISVIGFVLLILGIVFGKDIADSTIGVWFDFSGKGLTLALVIYGFIAAVLPVWLLLAPRDYLSTFLKIGAIIALAIGIVIVMPELKMPALTQFAERGNNGPVWSGDLFPFLFITIACGAVSGFHALIASGTTPKMLENEDQAPLIGYGGMLMESFVAIMALICASIIDPGIYFAMNSPMAFLNPSGLEDTVLAAATTVSNLGFQITPEDLRQLAIAVDEPSIISRTGGAPTLAIGMATILHGALGGLVKMDFWYHFAILFEALFILTAVDAGTRSARYMFQGILAVINPKWGRTDLLAVNLVATGVVVAAWGYFLYQGVVDPLGGINTLWPLFGIANQMLAAIALMLCAAVLYKMKQQRYVWVAIFPTAWLLICTMTAGWQKVFSADPAVGFFAKAAQLKGQFIEQPFVSNAIFSSVDKVEQVIFNNQVNGILTLFFMLVVVLLAIYSFKTALGGLRSAKPTANETPYEPFPEAVSKVQ